jgi:lysozyme family protein
MDERFEIFFSRLMRYEGVATVTDDPTDPGGLTKYGISKRSYPNVDIANLTEQQAKEIYHRDYYCAMKIENIIGNRIAWQLFDFGVNAGVYRAVKMLQKIVGVTQDGVIGKRTINAVNTFSGEVPLYIMYQSARIIHYLKLTDQNYSLTKFLRGWIKRVLEL